MDARKHTPGPWHVGGTGSASAKGMARVWGPDRAAVCAISERRTLGVDETPEMDANAKLIAAAPDLAEALYEAGVQLDLEAENYRDEDGRYEPHGKKLAALATKTRAALRAAGR